MLTASLLSLALVPIQYALVLIVGLHLAHALLRPGLLVVTCVALDVLLLTSIYSALIPIGMRGLCIGIVAGVSAATILSTRLRFWVSATPYFAAVVVITVVSQFFGRGADTMLQIVGTLTIAALGACLAACLTVEERLEVARVLVFLGVVQVAIGLGADVLGIGWVRSTFAATDSAGTGQAQYAASDNLILPGGWSRSAGTLGHPIPYALFLLIGLCLALREREIAPQWLRWAAVGVLASGLVLSGSRTTMMVALVLVSVYFAGIGRRLWRALVLVLTVPVGALVVYRFADFALQNARERSSFSLDFRLQAWSSFLNLGGRDLTEVLIGSGPASAPLLQTAGVIDLEGLRSLDNTFVTLFADLGVVGLGTYLVLLVVTMLRRDRPVWFALAGIWGMFLSFDVLGWTIFIFLFWFFIEIVLTSDRGPVRHEVSPEIVHDDVEGAPATSRALP